jgi:hypothetical protein
MNRREWYYMFIRETDKNMCNEQLIDDNTKRSSSPID